MRHQPRTLLITPFFDAALPSGGAGYSISLVREWLARGRRVAVICAENPAPPADLAPHLESGLLTLHPLVTPEEIRFTHHPHARVARLAREVIQLVEPAVVHVHNFQGMLGAVQAILSTPVPVILTALDFGLLCFNFYLDDGSETPCAGPVSPGACARCVRRRMRSGPGTLGAVLPRAMTRRIWPRFVRMDQMKSATELHAVMRRTLQTARRIIAPSPIVAASLRQYGAAPGRVVEMIYGVAPEKMVRPDKTLSESLRLAFLGGADRIKGLQVLLAASATLPPGLPLDMVACGGDAVRDAIQAAPQAARAYLRHRPLLFDEQLGRAHAEFDAVLVPSLWHENSPFVVLEALANGSPVIAADQAGIRHLVIPDYNGLLLPPGQVDAWANALRRAAEHPATIRRMQPNARFSRPVSAFADDLEEVEREVVVRRRGRRAAVSALPG